MSPSFVGIDPSIEMVVAAAVGGRVSVLGAVYGSLLVNFSKTFFSENFPQLWLFMMGALFISVVMVFPSGLAGFNLNEIRSRLQKRFKSKPLLEPAPPIPRDTPDASPTPGSAGGGL
jgi:urea transport system permease protein